MTKPVEEAGRRSASAFREALNRQLGRTTEAAAALAAETADEWGLSPGGAHDSPSSLRRYASRGDVGGGVDRGDRPGAADAPAYRGGETSDNARSWMRFATSSRDDGGLGLTREQAAGVVGNLQHESGPGIAPAGVTGDHGTAHGAAQWRHERFGRLQSKAKEWGLDWRTTAAQQRFMRWELDNTEQAAYASLRRSKTPEEAAGVFNRQYERSADPGRGRRASARRIFESPGEGSGQAERPPENANSLSPSPGRHPNLAEVDPRLREIMSAAATHLPPGYRMGVNEGYNAHGHAAHSQHHVRGRGALDVQIYDPQGRAIQNRGRDTTGLYTKLGRAAYGEMLARHPELKGRLAHGAAFGTHAGSGVPDLMHFDLGGERGNLAPHLSTLGPLPGVKYGETKKTAEGGD